MVIKKTADILKKISYKVIKNIKGQIFFMGSMTYGGNKVKSTMKKQQDLHIWCRTIISKEFLSLLSHDHAGAIATALT